MTALGRRRPWNRTLFGVAMVLITAMMAGCSTWIAGQPISSPYQSLGLTTLSAQPIAGPAIALSADGSTVATYIGSQICIHRVGHAAVHCFDIPGAGQLSAGFAPGGGYLAIGRNMAVSGPGTAFLIDLQTYSMRQIPPVAPAPPPVTSAASSDTSSGTATATAKANPGTATAKANPGTATATANPGTATAKANPGTATTTTSPGTTSRAANSANTAAEAGTDGGNYLGMAWNSQTGHLVMFNLLTSDLGPLGRVVDVNPVTDRPVVVGKATDRTEGFTGYLAAAGALAVFTVYVEGQIPPNLITVNLDSGAKQNLGAEGPVAGSAVPLAVSPDGSTLVMSTISQGALGRPQLVDLTSGQATPLPVAFSGTGMAAFSPDGKELAAVISTGESSSVLTIGSVRAGISRKITGAQGFSQSPSSLAWSRFDVLSIGGTDAADTLTVAGWHLKL